MGCVAERLIADLRPHRVLDAACGPGLLVKALRERGVDAHGIDGSEPAIASAAGERYDLVVCVNGIGQISNGNVSVLRALAAATDSLLFASEPAATGQSTLQWLELFAGYGFAPDIAFDASFVSPHAMLLRRQPPLPRDVLRLFSGYVDLRRGAEQSRIGRGDSGAPASSPGAAVAVELARYKERALSLEEQLAREREYLDTLRSVHAYLVQEVQKLRESSHKSANATASADPSPLASRRPPESPSREPAGGASREEIWRLAQDQVELHAEISRLERRTSGIERSVQNLTRTVNGILQSRIWQTLVSASGVLLRVTRRGERLPKRER
jgi:hypothetical protein